MEGTQNQKKIKTFCPICSGHCSAIATVENGKIIDWEPDLKGGLPYNPCRVFKGRSNMEIPVNPDRLKYPLKRIGKKGEGKWERISWDEALDSIAGKLTELKKKYGPETLAIGLGEPKGLEFVTGHRFANVFGTPNVASPHHLCGAPRFASSIITFGSGDYADPYPDEEHLPRLLIIWGSRLDQTRGSSERDWMRDSLIKGAKLIIIDPKNIDPVGRADMWIKPRPGSDGPLGMGMIKIIIEEKLYDKEFVDKWTVGFDRLVEEVKTFSLDDVEKATWVPKEQIMKLARMYAQIKPASIYGAGGIWSHGVRSFQQHRVLSILRTLTGSANIPEWGVRTTPANFTRPGRFAFFSQFPRNPAKTVGNEFKYAIKAAYVPGNALAKGILSEKPYPIKAGMFILTNPLTSYPDAREIYDALMKLELLVVFELFMVPTAAIADYVLPAATSGEYNAIGYWGGEGYMRAFPKLVEPPGEAWPDVKILNELAKKLGMGKYFWNDYNESLDEILKPSGLNWEGFLEQRILKPTREYIKDEEIKLKTPSGKIEIYSENVGKVFGYGPMPRWKDLSTPPFELSDKYPYALTSACDEEYKLTSFKHVKYLRNYKPEPTVELHPDTAKKIGAKEGDWICIETYKGKITQKLVINPTLDPRVVFASFGWYFPEEPSNACQWDKANINILIDSSKSDLATGSMELRGFPCKVYKPTK